MQLWDKFTGWDLGQSFGSSGDNNEQHGMDTYHI
jgi:hypothetical protein